MDYARRQKALLPELHRARVDALLVTHLPNIRYLCGFTGSAGVLVVTGEGSVLFTDGRYREQARQEVTGARVVIAKVAALAAAAQWIGSFPRAGSRGALLAVGVEAEHMRLVERTAVKKVLAAVNPHPVAPKTGATRVGHPPRGANRRPGVRLREVGPVIEQGRMVKDADELGRMRAAAKLAVSLLDVALEAVRPGVAELEVAARMEHEARRCGAEGMSFETIVASGPRSALPHGRATPAAIPRRGFVVLDFGVILDGYCSDMTRTVHVGKASTAEREMYEAVRRAQEAGVAAVGAGCACGDVDRAARSVLRRSGLARYFSHSTGHGVGLEIHEPPRVARNQADRLQAGMVITIEPGVYVPGRGGVRIEDMVVVTNRGCEVLTPAPRQLVVL
jgi:Xaa-Pro aminopeptidase